MKKDESNNDQEKQELVIVKDKTERNIVAANFKEVLDERESLERIRKMADIPALTRAELDEAKILHSGMVNTKLLNAFRELRTKIYQDINTEENFILMISSVAPEGGSSFVSLNLAASIALDRSKTSIVIDCNVYSPSVQNLFPIEPSYGLTDYLDNITLEPEDIIYSSGVKRLRLIPAGKQQEHGVELFTSSRMKRLLSELKSRYKDRNIILDAPSLSSSADARILSELCDYVVLVVPYGKLTGSQLKSAIGAIDKEKLIGVVFNS